MKMINPQVYTLFVSLSNVEIHHVNSHANASSCPIDI